MPYQDEEINRMCKKNNTQENGRVKERKKILTQQHLTVHSLDRAKFGSCKIWVMQNLSYAKFGFCKIWIVQNLYCAKFGLSKIWIMQSLD